MSNVPAALACSPPKKDNFTKGTESYYSNSFFSQLALHIREWKMLSRRSHGRRDGLFRSEADVLVNVFFRHASRLVHAWYTCDVKGVLWTNHAVYYACIVVY